MAFAKQLLGLDFNPYALDVLLVLGNSAMDKAWKKADELRSTGKSVELCYESDPKSIRALAQARRAKQVMEV